MSASVSNAWRIAAVSVALLALGLVAPGLASAASYLTTLESSGAAVAAGSPANATVRFGACGTLLASGTVTSNGKPTDALAFTAGAGSGGGCGEGGPSLEGTITGAKLNHAGQLSLSGTMTYTTGLPMPCTYTLEKLHGTVAIPGPSTASVSGTGKRVGGPKTGCATKATLEGVEATLSPSESGPAFEVVLAKR